MTKKNPVLKAEVRTVTGRKVKHLRNSGQLPSSVYGKDMEPISIQVSEKEMAKIFAHSGESGLVDLDLDGKTLPVLFRNPQYHAVSGLLTHFDCYKVNLKEKITTAVPIEFVGEAPATKEGKVLVEVVNEVEVEALPADLPEKIEVDLSKLVSVDVMITVADIKIDGKYEIKSDMSQVLAKVEEPRVEEVVVAEAPTETVVAPAMNQKTEEEKAADDAKKAEEKKKEKE
ncbi:50S ribosomal protein L25 [Candidatus Shapirobacteria bacterium]|nr:50S ribosomal protein L25 [Candidatus Shapirobacteria bacterium]